MTKSQRRKALREAGVTASEIAAELALNPSTVSRVLNGDAASLRVAEHVAQRCGVPLGRMFPRYRHLTGAA
jgi:transcriptional regulator with XRE-family HTH domain